jgi:hypothetical protein
MRAVRIVIGIVVALLFLAPATAWAAPGGSDRTNAILLTGNAHVEEDEVMGTVVIFDGRAGLDLRRET